MHIRELRLVICPTNCLYKAVKIMTDCRQRIANVGKKTKKAWFLYLFSKFKNQAIKSTGRAFSLSEDRGMQGISSEGPLEMRGWASPSKRRASDMYTSLTRLVKAGKKFKAIPHYIYVARGTKSIMVQIMMGFELVGRQKSNRSHRKL